MITEVYLIGGMHCAACSASVEKVTRGIKGVSESNVNLTTEKMTITYDEDLVTPEIIIRYVESAGFDIEPEKKRSKGDKNNTIERPLAKKEESSVSLVFAGIFAFGLLYLCMGPMLFGINIPMSPINIAITEMLLALGIMFIGKDHFKSGFKSLFHKAPNMDTLVAVSCVVSFTYSLVQTYRMSSVQGGSSHELYYESAGVVLFFIMLGKHMEARSKAKTKDAIEGLMNLAPVTAMLVTADGISKEISAEDLKVGDKVMISAGTRVPADCIVYEGSGDFDESMFTGESLPVHKATGDKLIGGSVLSDGSVVFAEVKNVGEDTTLAGIIKFVEDAQGKKAPIASLADRVAGIFVPTVMTIAVVAAAIWALLGQSPSFVLKIFTTVLVIACPCALGLATPTAIICGTGLGAKNGILIRSGEALEITHKADVVVLDKTGTVTEGKPMVLDVFGIGCSEDFVLKTAADVEAYSDHPLAKAVVKAAREKDLLSGDKLEEYIYVSGRGIVAENKDHDYIYAGNRLMMEEHKVDCNAIGEFEKNASARGQSIIYIAVNNVLVGALSLADTIRKETPELIQRLHDMGLKTVLLTGDNKAAAEYVGKTVGADEIIAEVLPQDKAAVIENIKSEGKKVIMVGDGINDAPALAAADIGCAIGSGSDIAIDSADIVLMKDDPLDVARAIKLSKLTITNIKQNLFWAFFYNCIGIPIAAGALFPINGMLLTPMIGGLAMSFSSVFVVSNALRLKGKRL